MRSKIMILTGGPGTGKSTTTMGIIRAFQGQQILLAAPTGRAAKRLSEVTRMEAKTIHRLLEFKPPEGYKRKEDKGDPNPHSPLEVDRADILDDYNKYARRLVAMLPFKEVKNALTEWLDSTIDDKGDLELVKRLMSNPEGLVKIARAKARSDAKEAAKKPVSAQSDTGTRVCQR